MTEKKDNENFKCKAMICSTDLEQDKKKTKDKMG
jgi:hypothetical protein